MKDDIIIELVKTKNYTEASEKLYVYFPVIKKFVLKNNGTIEDAEDIYQESLIIFINKVRTNELVLKSTINTYLYGICRFLWLNKLKQNKKNKTVEIEKIKETTYEEDVLFSNDSSYEIRLAEMAFKSLGEKCKQLLLLFYFNKLSLKEIAVKLKFGSEKTAKNQKYRCLDKAKENFKILKTNTHE